MTMNLLSTGITTSDLSLPPLGVGEISPVAVKRQTQRTALAILDTIGLPGCFSHGNENAGAVDYQRVPRNGG
jgi:hypothetical protein